MNNQKNPALEKSVNIHLLNIEVSVLSTAGLSSSLSPSSPPRTSRVTLWVFLDLLTFTFISQNMDLFSRTPLYCTCIHILSYYIYNVMCGELREILFLLLFLKSAYRGHWKETTILSCSKTGQLRNWATNLQAMRHCQMWGSTLEPQQMFSVPGLTVPWCWLIWHISHIYSKKKKKKSVLLLGFCSLAHRGWHGLPQHWTYSLLST